MDDDLGRHLLLLTFDLPFDPVCQLIKDFLAQRKLTTTKELAHLSIDEFNGICETALIVDIIAKEWKLYKFNTEEIVGEV